MIKKPFVLFLALGMVALSGCHSLHLARLPASESLEFEPLPVHQRVMNEVRVRWEVREDVTAYCAKTVGMGWEQANITPPLACASWSAARKECTIVTGTITSHVALGHELRHCFEGHFHR